MNRAASKAISYQLVSGSKQTNIIPNQTNIMPNTSIQEIKPTSKARLPVFLRRNGTAPVLSYCLLALALTFTYQPATAAELPVALGSASTFAVLAGQTVTSTGESILLGNLGVSPGSAVTGFPPGAVLGKIHAADSASARAQYDLTTAYNNAAGRRTAPVAVSGNIGGRTLTPGLYKSTSGLEISSGDLTLNAQGNPNAVFIFQMASTLTTTSGRKVILTGKAQAANVFWQVGSSATIGTTTVFKGNILALTSISLATGATLEGRALARNGSVTMQDNDVTIPILSATSAKAPPSAPSTKRPAK